MKSPVRRYSYINAKLRARIGSMLDEKKIDALLRSGSIEELLQQLRDTSYATLASVFDQTGDVQRLEAELFKREVELHKDVAALLDGEHAELVLALTRKLEVENLKGVLRLWFSGTVKKQNIDYRFGYLFQGDIVSSIDWNQIINAPDYQEVLHALAETPYGPVMAQFDTEQIVAKGVFSLETALDRCWFHELRNTVAKLPGNDRKILSMVLDADTDLKNVINLIRFGWMYRLAAVDLRVLMLEGGSINGSREFEEYLASDPQLRSPMQLVRRRFPKLAKELSEQPKTGGSSSVAEQTVRIERFLFELRKKEFIAMLGGYPFTIGIVLAYFFLSERQDKMIRALVNGKYYGWDAQTIRGFAT
ncbi:MAG: ATPase [Spirochaetae bacterium HGW-Spirochaetae-8]|nr:MAG: ATPase [Spirochaetae bacterium HGW-Spirochaetae-8]